ncbi:hypothetical protein T07_7717 [Trichinella nelsoni]|uniref:Uncharacterized protein n=1 Tax=Trichinella nelsoni TaxID=6336 RepID=A0A0V0RFM7_9BILA|nr:hypothetical protein T07_7717 [Trichinella nelsoni]
MHSCSVVLIICFPNTLPDDFVVEDGYNRSIIHHLFVHSFIHSFIHKAFFNCKLILMQMHMKCSTSFGLPINLKFSCSTVEIFTC